jgi:hypothetical protein
MQRSLCLPGGLLGKRPRQRPMAVRCLQLPTKSTTAISGGAAKGHAPHCPPKTAESALLHAPLSARLDEISLPLGVSKRTSFWPIWPSWQARRPSPAQQLRKNRWGGGVPPPAPPPAPLRGALAGPRPAQNPQEGGVSRITSYGRRVQLPCSE